MIYDLRELRNHTTAIVNGKASETERESIWMQSYSIDALIAIAERLDALIEAVNRVTGQVCEMNQRQTNVTNSLDRIVSAINESNSDYELIEAVEKTNQTVAEVTAKLRGEA